MCLQGSLLEHLGKLVSGPGWHALTYTCHLMYTKDVRHGQEGSYITYDAYVQRASMRVLLNGLTMG